MTKEIHPNSNKYADVPIRIRSWGIIILILTVALSQPVLTYLFSCLLSFIAMKEFMQMTGWKAGIKTNLVLGTLTAAQFFILYFCDYTQLILFTAFYILVIFTTHYLIFKTKPASFYLQSGIGVILCVFSISHIILIRLLPSYNESFFAGIKLIMYLIILTELNDVFQYLSGKRFGKHKITLNISPNKTREGLLGGIICTCLLAIILGVIMFAKTNLFICFLLGFSISILGFLGDLFMSYIKRRAAVKDTSSLIPGHGGLLDRLDSLLFILPLYYWFMVFYYPNML